MLAGAGLAACAARPAARPDPTPPAPETAKVIRVPGKQAADENMTVVGTIGHLAQEDIQEALAPRWPQVSGCFESARATLPELGGTVSLKVHVGAAGRVDRAFITRSDLGSWAAERCLLGVVETTLFPAPQGGSEAEFELPVAFRARQEASPLADWPAATPRRDLRECRDRQPGIGALRMTLYVAPGGRVVSLGLDADQPIGEAVGACMLERASRWPTGSSRSGKVGKTTLGVSDDDK